MYKAEPASKPVKKVHRKHKKPPINPPSLESSKDAIVPKRNRYYPKILDHKALLALRSYHSIHKAPKYMTESRNLSSDNAGEVVPEVTEETVHQSNRKRKAEPIDSEVDLFKKDKNRIPIKFCDIHPKFAQKMDSKQPKPKSEKESSSAEQQKASILQPESATKRPSAHLKKNNKEVRTSPANNDILVKYPVLKDQELVSKFMQVSLSNNQKGRLRQVIKEITKGSSPKHLPDVLNNRIQVILRSSDNLTETDLRKIRILYNMLNTVTVNQKLLENQAEPEPSKKKKKVKEDKEGKKEEAKETLKKPKSRYVVFVGNLPKDVTKEQIMQHFADLGDFVKSVRIPAKREDKNNAIAYVELSTGTSYEMALSKNHSMLGNRRINVVYSAPKNSKMTKTQAKGKAAKLAAMAKNGQLVGSVPLTKKRSQRRAKARKARKAAEEAQSI